MDFDRKQLEQIANRAQARIDEIYSLFAVPGEPPAITPGIAQCVLQALRDQSWELRDVSHLTVEAALATSQPTPAPKPQPEHEPQLGPEPQPEPQPQPESAHPTAKRPAQLSQPADEPTDADLLAFLRQISTDGTLPSSAEYNRARPDGYPSSGTLVTRFGCRWTELAEKTGLRLSGRQLGGKRLHQQKREAAATDSGGSPPARDDASFRHRNAGDKPAEVSDHARSILGPEHVTINGYK